jgi:diguanylate cyclase (GGDEF)-like protein/PAS domain S-box-containing protein
MSCHSGTLLIINDHVIDDHDAHVDPLCRRLQGEGYTTTAVTESEQALVLLETQDFDLALVNTLRPGNDGLATLQDLRRTYTVSELPVIMLTSTNASAETVRAFSLGANDCVAASIDFPELVARIQAHISHRQVEAARRKSEERLALAVCGSNDGVWDWHLSTNELYCSPRWKSILGLPETLGDDKPDTWFSLVHPEDRSRLLADVASHCQGTALHFTNEHRMLHADGTYRWVLCRGAIVRNARGEAYRMTGFLTDITERKGADGLTGLPNRLLFVDRLAQTMQHATRTPHALSAVLALEIDRLPIIKASLGSSAGDQLLIAAMQRLRQCLRSGDTVTHFNADYTIARCASDGFVILVDNISTVSDAIRVTKRLQKALAMPFTLDKHEVSTTVSAGIALSATGCEGPDDCLRNADIALYHAKVRGPGSYEVFHTSMHAAAVTRLQLEQELRSCIEKQEFHLCYQPIVLMHTGKIRGFEALVRWQHPTRGLVSPTEFIPLAEETGLIVPLGMWVFREACRQMRIWQQRFSAHPPLFISVNLSAKQLEQADLVTAFDRILQDMELDPRSVKLELTESSLLKKRFSIATVLTHLQDLGMHICLDDFGTGYSSLSYLHSFPIHTLKIDRTFISRMGSDAQSAAIVQTILTLAHHLGMDVVAEGVESAQQFFDLRTLGCEYAQGYFLSKPLDREAASALLAADPQW